MNLPGTLPDTEKMVTQGIGMLWNTNEMCRDSFQMVHG